MRDIQADNPLPLTWWTVTPNFGDLLSPFLVSRLARRPVALVEQKPRRGRRLERWKLRPAVRSYLAIGSIISRASDHSIVWGAGAFGTERPEDLSPKARYLAVRGPLTRNLLRIHGIECPAVYGDPALLMPKVFSRPAEKTARVGLVLRWSEHRWNTCRVGEGVRKIYLGGNDIEKTLVDLLSCERIVSSSLHGLILADAYGIPSAWLDSETPKGLAFKFHDHFLAVNAVRPPQSLSFQDTRPLEAAALEDALMFTDGGIQFDEAALLAACPFLATDSLDESKQEAGGVEATG